MQFGKIMRWLWVGSVFLLFISLSCLPVTTYAAKPGSKANGLTSLNSIMKQIGGIMVDLYPRIIMVGPLSRDEVASIRSDLADMETLFAFAEPFINTRADSYQVSYEFVSEYLNVLQSILATNDVDMARRHLYAFGEICSTCHTQDTTLRTLFKGVSRKQFSSDLAYAEFSFMTRDYKPAVKYFRRYLNSPGDKTEWELVQPLQRLVLIYVQVYKQPNKLIDILQQSRSLKQHTEETLAEVDHWIKGAKALEVLLEQTKSPMNFQTIMSGVAKYLAPMEGIVQSASNAEDDIARLWLRGKMFEYLNTKPKRSEIPVLLYWLSVADRSLAYNFYFSLANLYLKQCVLKYPSHPYARNCYREYEYFVENTYTVQGEAIPPGIAEEMRTMQEALSHATKRKNYVP